MDQSKWSLPRQRLLQRAKDTQNLLRPRLKVHCVWCHGVVLHFFIVHPGIAADSALVLEAFLRTMEDVVEIFASAGKTLPRECMIWETWIYWVADLARLCESQCLFVRVGLYPSKSDNTVRENKNNGCMKMMSTLLMKNKLDFISYLFPRVGHSHGTLGALKKLQQQLLDKFEVSTVLTVFEVLVNGFVPWSTETSGLVYFLLPFALSIWYVIRQTWWWLLAALQDSPSLSCGCWLLPLKSGKWRAFSSG